MVRGGERGAGGFPSFLGSREARTGEVVKRPLHSTPHRPLPRPRCHCSTARRRDREWSANSDFDPSTAVFTPDSEAEKRLVRKIDRRIVPTIWLLYTLSYLDRANIGNAKIGGMEKSLTSPPRNTLRHPAPFLLPLNMLLTRVRPSMYLSILCFLWGAVATCMAAVDSWKSLAAVRFCLGITEAGFAPGIAFYPLLMVQAPRTRQAVLDYYTATAVSGAFSGLLAGVITDHLKLARGIEGWRWLLLIEGVGSCFVACFTWMILPDWPSTTKWLTPEEKSSASPTTASATPQPAPPSPPTSPPQRWPSPTGAPGILVLMYMLATGSQTIQYFIPTLVSQTGYKGFTAQYMTIPVYMVALVGILVFSFVSDWRREEGELDYGGGAYCGGLVCCYGGGGEFEGEVCVFVFGGWGLYAFCPLTLLWVSSIIDHPAEKRAIAMRCASIYGSFLWPSNTGPRYVQGFAVTTVFVFLLAALAQINKYLPDQVPPPRASTRSRGILPWGEGGTYRVDEEC
ncbi:major facilitator superfamily domain-containing protein [Lyophyllum atratum]|nr:major facilitator superfamily domain-containing protein [Lyophyllum atratum]